MHVGGVVFKLKEMLDAAALPFYFLTGRRPWSPGYYTKNDGGQRTKPDP